MIHIQSQELTIPTRTTLAGYQAEIDALGDYEAKVRLADNRFRQYNRIGNTAFHEVRYVLDSMCSGARRCMYCEDSFANEVDHHKPKNLYPEHVFQWENYLYSCGPCNRPKGSQFAVFRPNGEVLEVGRRRNSPVIPPSAGDPVLLNPRIENPLEFIMLDILGGTFRFVPNPDANVQQIRRADYTIRILGLNSRDPLPKARREAYENYIARLELYIKRCDAHVPISELNLVKNALCRMQHPTVWREMLRQHARIPQINHLFQSAPEALEWWPLQTA